METKELGTDIEEQMVEKSSHRIAFTRFDQGQPSQVQESIIRETPISLFINGKEMVTLMCTPTKETYLVAGFLYLEGIVSSVEDILFMRVCAEESVADVRLTKDLPVESTVRTLTTGCGGGTTFLSRASIGPVEADTRIAAEQVTRLLVALLQGARLYRETGGVHTSALSDGERLLVVAEDVGRHNTIDKIAGECFLTDVPTHGRIILTTGRVSSEMLIKSARMGIPIVISRSSPTDMAVEIARELNITLVGYVRGRSFNAYSHDWRIT